jgi:hypothetical protein
LGILASRLLGLYCSSHSYLVGRCHPCLSCFVVGLGRLLGKQANWKQSGATIPMRCQPLRRIAHSLPWTVSGIRCAYRVSVSHRAGAFSSLQCPYPYTPRPRRQGRFARECSACWAGIRTPGQVLPNLHTSCSVPGIQGRRYRRRWPQQRRSRPQEL